MKMLKFDKMPCFNMNSSHQRRLLSALSLVFFCYHFSSIVLLGSKKRYIPKIKLKEHILNKKKSIFKLRRKRYIDYLESVIFFNLSLGVSSWSWQIQTQYFLWCSGQCHNFCYVSSVLLDLNNYDWEEIRSKAHYSVEEINNWSIPLGMSTLALSSFVLPPCNLLAIENEKAKQETMTLAYMLNIFPSFIYRQILLAKAMKQDFYNISLEHCIVSISLPGSGFILVTLTRCLTESRILKWLSHVLYISSI